MNTRKAFEGILKNWGNNVLIQRRLETDNSAIKEYSNILERHTVRSRIPSAGTDEENEGVLHNVDMVYYFKWDANPKEGDRVYENYDRGVNDVRIFDITYTIPMRGRGGEIVFWTVGAQREVIK